MADTVAVMNSGRIEQMGHPADMYEFPATAFVANFLGQANLLAGEVTGHSGDDLEVSAYGNRFALPAARSRAVTSTVHLGVRPEKVHLVGSLDEVPAGRCAIPGVITDSSYIGVSTQYLVRTPWGAEISVFAPNSGIAAPLAPGEQVVAYWQPGHAFLLDRAASDDQAAPSVGSGASARTVEAGASVGPSASAVAPVGVAE